MNNLRNDLELAVQDMENSIRAHEISSNKLQNACAAILSRFSEPNSKLLPVIPLTLPQSLGVVNLLLLMRLRLRQRLQMIFLQNHSSCLQSCQLFQIKMKHLVQRSYRFLVFFNDKPNDPVQPPARKEPQ